MDAVASLAVSVQSNRAEETTHNESVYEYVTLSPLLPSIHRIMLPMAIQKYQQEEQELRKLYQFTKMTQVLSLKLVLLIHKTMSPMGAQTSKTGAGATQDVPMYEEVTDPISLVSTIAMALISVHNNYRELMAVIDRHCNLWC